MSPAPDLSVSLQKLEKGNKKERKKHMLWSKDFPGETAEGCYFKKLANPSRR